MTTKVTRQMVARGSFGIAPINPINGRPKAGAEHVVNVWHVERDGQQIGTYATRAEARDAAR